MQKKDHSASERRKYIRLDSVFPVSFKLLSLEGGQNISDWIQGFTNNISKGGICLTINNLKPELASLLKAQQAKLSLKIEMPLSKNPVSALAKIAWVKNIAAEFDKYIVGLSYEEIDSCLNNKIMRYARAKKLFLPIALSLIILLGAGFTINTYLNIKLIEGNKALVGQLVKILQETSIAKQKVKEIERGRQDLQLKIQTLQLQIKSTQEEKEGLEKQAQLEESRAAKKINELNFLTDRLTNEKLALQEQLIALQHNENTVAEELMRLDKKKVDLEKANLGKMYQWLKIHQNPRTGLVMSFEGDSDLADWAFIYDQSLVVQAYTNLGDFERAKRMLNFFLKQAKRKEDLFFNAYYSNDGQPAEFVVHYGPNIWVGIAILQYAKKSQDQEFVSLAEEIARGVIAMQSKDNDGGIIGGPDVSWYSTEHNLDAYAFFNMLYAVTGKPIYLAARDKTLNWLVQHTYDKVDIPIKRGKGDSTIATDTYAWSIAAIGPDKLEQLGMDPDRIIEFAEQNCSVEVSYIRPEGTTIKIKGFDFAPQRHVARGGVVSSEWTAQMVMAFKIMANFYYKKNMIAKARAYELKADDYLSQLGNMIISSSSPSGQGESCLPYATQDFVDTGHGWMTPKGDSTGSVAGTAYSLFAYYGYNPLELK